MARKVFFSFHYQDVLDLRADVVRQYCLAAAGGEDAGFIDAPTWYDASIGGQGPIRRLIDSELENTSVTCVLIGTQTSARRWVRYEIIASILRGNRIVGVHINGIPDRSQRTKPAGSNPFEQLALAFSSDGSSLKVLQHSSGAWLPYEDNPGWPLSKAASPEKRGKRVQLSTMYPVYDWAEGYGPERFARWLGVTEPGV